MKAMARSNGGGRSRAQAALFDGIMFLLISSMSAAMMYSFMVTYGDSQDRVMRSSHVLNYMQSTMKSIYSVDVSTLENVPVIKAPDGKAAALCGDLGKWQGAITVGDLLKKDLSDPYQSCGTPAATPTAGDFCGIYDSGKLDDKYGNAYTPGKTALWCLLDEVMKPFTQAGYKYLAEVLNGNQFQTYPSNAEYVITNSLVVQANEGKSFARGQRLCEAVSENYKDVLTVSAPFRILIEDDTGVPQTIQYVLRVCIWPSTEEPIR